MSSPLSASQMRAKYGVPESNPGSEFAKNEYRGPSKVRPYSKANRDTSGQATAWDNQNPGRIGSFQDFGSGNPTMPQPGA
jgi:hypothetical protein